jgi:hypothetical protein
VCKEVNHRRIKKAAITALSDEESRAELRGGKREKRDRKRKKKREKDIGEKREMVRVGELR